MNATLSVWKMIRHFLRRARYRRGGHRGFGETPKFPNAALQIHCIMGMISWKSSGLWFLEDPEARTEPFPRFHPAREIVVRDDWTLGRGSELWMARMAN